MCKLRISFWLRISKHKFSSEKEKYPQADLWSAIVKDSKDIKTTISRIRFGKHPYLPAKIGEAKVKILFAKVKEATFQQKGTSFGADITTIENQKIRAEVDPGMVLSGEVSLGDFSIELKNVDSSKRYFCN